QDRRGQAALRTDPQRSRPATRRLDRAEVRRRSRVQRVDRRGRHSAPIISRLARRQKTEGRRPRRSVLNPSNPWSKQTEISDLTRASRSFSPQVTILSHQTTTASIPSAPTRSTPVTLP